MVSSRREEIVAYSLKKEEILALINENWATFCRLNGLRKTWWFIVCGTLTRYLSIYFVSMSHSFVTGPWARPFPGWKFYTFWNLAIFPLNSGFDSQGFVIFSVFFSPHPFIDRNESIIVNYPGVAWLHT